jgi:CRP-like cAMP-binding protein
LDISLIPLTRSSFIFNVEMEQLFEYFDLHYKISSEAKAAILQVTKILKIKKNNILQPIGHTCKTIYFLKTGLARIYYYKEDLDITESFAFENMLLARIESLFTGKPSRKGIQMIEDSELIAIDSTELFKLYDKFHDIERLMRIVTERLYIDTVNRIESIQFHTAEERYIELLKSSPDIIKRVPLKYISSFLGITQVSLSRIRAGI